MADAPPPSTRDAVRARLAQALARRAAPHAGAARRVLDDRLAALAAAPSSPPDAPFAGPRAPTRSALAELLDHAARQKPTPLLGAVAKAREPSPQKAAAPGAAADARTLQFFRRTWSRLSADQRLAQSRATLPENAGPLNSHHLVHRSLTLMRELSPEYLERFVGYVDALQWLEQANEAAEAAVGLRPAAPRKSAPLRR
jgi:hypothetical protein